MFAQKTETKKVMNKIMKKEMNQPRTKAREQTAPQMPWLGSRIGFGQKDDHIWGGDSVVQRYVARYKPLSLFAPMTEEEQGFQAKAQEIDGKLQQAHAEFLADDFSDASPQYTAVYLLRKHNYDNHIQDMHPATAAGYVIESKVTERIKNDPDVSIQVTGLLKGTRPDIVLENGGQYGLLDITASNSAGHILLKKGNWTGHQNITYVAELIYPSINFGSMAPIALTQKQKEQIMQHAAGLQNAYQERVDLCESNLVENRRRIMGALFGKDICFKGCTGRQREIIINNFGQFGIQLLLFPGWKITGFEMENFLPDPETYSIWDMDRKAQILIDAIRKNRLFGMKPL